MNIEVGTNDKISSEYENESFYLLPYFDDQIKQHFIVSSVSAMFKKIPDTKYKIETIIICGIKKTKVTIYTTGLHESKLDYLETSIKHLDNFLGNVYKTFN
jgi:hypothetical protein